MLHHMARTALHAAAAAVLGAALAGCSSSNPTAPSPNQGFDPEQFLRPGSYRLIVVTTSQQIPNCAGSQDQNRFFALAAVVTVTRDGDTWTARSTTAADGDVEFRLRRAADNTVAGSRVLIIAVEGSARGSAQSSAPNEFPQSISFGNGESRLSGMALFQGSAQGTATGAIRITSSIFGSFECPAVSWTLLPAFAPG